VFKVNKNRPATQTVESKSTVCFAFLNFTQLS